MSSTKRRKNSIVWATQLMLDKEFCRTTPIEILRHLAKRGHLVKLYATWSKTRYEGNELDFPVCCVPIREVPIFRPLLFAIITFFLLPIQSLIEKPSFVLVTPGALTIPVAIWKPVLARCMRTKFVLIILSTPVEIRGRRGALQTLFFEISVMLAQKAFNGVTILTDSMKEEVSRRFHLDPARIGVFTDGVSIELFDSARCADEAYRMKKEMGLVDKIVVLYHGLFGLDRGIVESVKEMAKLENDDVVLFLLGNGPALPAIEATVREKNLQDRVIVHEAVKYTDVPKYIAMSDVGLVPLPNIPDWLHQNPLNLLECLAMEKPVIVTDIPANRLVVGSSKCAIYISSPTELRNAVSYLRDNYRFLKRWGSCGRAIIMDKYTWAKVAERIEKYLATCR